MTTSSQPTEDDQRALWNGSAARAWVDGQELMDEALRPFEDLLLAEVAAAAGQRVLDVGCGTGTTTLAIARREGTRGLGVDISEPMIAVAKARAAAERSSAEFVCADAQTHAFAPASYDMIVSRFGVMFFADPIAAFANLRRAAEPGAALRVVVWRRPDDNPFMMAAERSAAPLLPSLPPRRADAPGQFGLADPQRVEGILRQSGWSEPELRPVDLPCTFPAAELMGYATRFGPLGRMLGELDDATKARVVEALRAGFAPYVHGDQVRFTAACWSVGARAR